ncbi:guanine nucleotide exchange factor subunit RIC1-like isoform X2 [Ptychodera flava]|uniref:guanine nucleotide exchange factor subunit RIC1-like isoform X2 n=1 Tax=Ptychodera flava TaxID=63121 RepID=UPI00396A6BF3
MYFPVGWPKLLSLPSEEEDVLQFVVANRDKTLFAVLTSQAVYVWFCKPCVHVVSYRRSDDSVIVLGKNQVAEWKPDSTALAVTTSGGHLLFYKIDHEGSGSLYAQKHHRHRQDSIEVDNHLVPAMKISIAGTLQIHGGIKSMVCFKDELMVSSGHGILMRVRWDGVVNDKMSISINTIRFSIDLQQSRQTQLDQPGVYFNQIEYCPLLGGFAVILGDGRAGFLTAPSARFEPQSVHGVWAQEVTNGSCIAANHKYRLIAYGCKNGQGIVYTVDEITGSLLVSHRLALSNTDYPDACNAAGAVTTLKWTPDGCALAMSWQNGGLALWSVFGAKLLCTLGGDYGLQAGSNFSLAHDSFSQDAFRDNPLQIKAMEWGMEGYHLWITTTPKKSEKNSSDLRSLESSGDLLQLQFVKSALTVNPCRCNHEHLFLQGEDRLYINTGDTILKTNTEQIASGGSPVREMPPVLNSAGPTTQGPSLLIGNKQWQIIQLPLGYLSTNWPIKYAAVDRAGHCVAVAGKTGLAHYALFTRRWKLFGNETQEQDMVVNGGLCWWRDFIIVACYNLNESRDEIRLYPRVSNLDNAFATITKVPYQVLLVNVFRDILIVFCADYHVTMYNIERRDTKPNPTGVLTRIQDLSLANFVPHPSSLISLTLTSLRSETASSKMPSSSREAESLIVNVAGRLLMLQRDRSKPQYKEKDRKKAPQELPFLAPVVLASSVENMWAPVGYSKEKPHLMEALWLGCGAVGMKVWLPLFPTKEDKPHSFLAKRIMLPFKLQIYPLAVLFADAVVLGAANDVLTFDPMSPGLVLSCQQGLPYCVMERTTQIYLHHILRQLLRRNLGFHALDIARSCTSLPYFSHVLELMLHEVLEAEATASEPIPDALLPRVVAFIHEFPQFLQTVVHCARKTEIALWPYLFATVGNPRDLFEECIQSEAFETAASYLIILQNLENPKVSRHHATQLLDCTLDHGKWELCKDLVRFLRAIGPNDPESSPRPTAPINSPAIFPHSATTPKAESMTAFPFSPALAATQRNRSSSYTNPNFPPTSANDKQRSSSAHQQIPDRKSSVHRKDSGGSADEFFLDTILTRHARKLLSIGKLKDLGLFAAHLEFPLIGWLRKERLRVAKVEDPVESLKKLHNDFLWPLPAFPLVSVSHLPPPKYVGRLYSQSSSGSASQTGLDNNVNGVSIDDEVDSGILATSGSNHGYISSPIPSSKSRQQATTQTEDLLCDGKTEDAVLKPITPIKAMGTDEVSLSTCTTTEMTSENSSTLGENEYGLLDDSPWSSSQQLAELELLSQELVHKGPPQSEAELRYLQKIFSEATCLEWSLLLAVVLRDPVAVTSVVNTASMTECPLEMIGRMREALSFLELWADTECPGYRPFLYSLKDQAQVLTAIVNSESTVKTPSKTPPDTPTSPTPEASFTGSELSFHGSHGNRTDDENEVRTLDGNSESEISDVENEIGNDENGYQCRVS